MLLIYPEIFFSMLFLLKAKTSGSKELVHERFLPALFKHISENSEPRMKEIIANWIKQLDEKDEYIQLFKNYNICDLIIIDEEERQAEKNLRKRKAKDVSDRYQSCNRIKGSDVQKRRKRQHLTAYPTKIIEPPNFEVLKHINRGALKTTLSVFTSPDRKYCYEYFWDKSKGYFLCYACCSRKVRMSARIIKRKGKSAVMLKGTQHVCKERIYKRIIEKPNFEVISYRFRNAIIQRLIVFSDDTQTTCYEYLWSKRCNLWHCTGCLQAKPKRWTAADICQKEDGTDFVMLKPCEGHVCEMIQFNREKYIGKEIVEASNFKIFKNIQNCVDRSKMVLFSSSNKTACYEYSWHNSNRDACSYFCCNTCKKSGKHVAAKVYQDSDGSEYLMLTKTKHVCKPCKFEPEKFVVSEDVISECSDFKVFEYKHNGVMQSKLIVFRSTNKNLCYEFFWNKIIKKYICTYCPRGNHVTAAVCQGGDGKDYLKLYNAQHICELREYEPSKYKDDVIVAKSLYEIASISTREDAFQKSLFIYTTEEKKYYYRFLYNKTAKYFYCSKCYLLKVNLTATIQNEGKEDECVFMSHQKHICEPVTNGNFIMAPKYRLVKRKTRGAVRQKLAVFTNSERSVCHEYTWYEKSKSFICCACSTRHSVHVYAKVIKSDKNEECVQLSEKPHKCDPIKFVPEDDTTKIV